MLADYFAAAMKTARIEQMEDGRHWAEIPAMPGVWADGDSPEECHETLREVLEEWTLIGYWQHATLPIIDGIDPNLKMIPEQEAHETSGVDSEVA